MGEVGLVFVLDSHFMQSYWVENISLHEPGLEVSVLFLRVLPMLGPIWTNFTRKRTNSTRVFSTRKRTFTNSVSASSNLLQWDAYGAKMALFRLHYAFFGHVAWLCSLKKPSRGRETAHFSHNDHSAQQVYFSANPFVWGSSILVQISLCDSSGEALSISLKFVLAIAKEALPKSNW